MKKITGAGKAITALLCCSLLFTQTALTAFAVSNKESLQNNDLQNDEYVAQVLADKKNDYDAYLEQYKNEARPVLTEKINVLAANFNSIVPENGYRVLDQYESHQKALLVQESLQYVEYIVQVPRSGLYSLALEHCPINNDSASYELSLEINGKVPFSQAASLYIYNTYVPEANAPITDQNGNQFAARRVVMEKFTTNVLGNPDGDYDEPLAFYLREGDNKIRITMRRPRAFILGSLSVCQDNRPIPYSEYRQSVSPQPDGSAYQIVEAESAARQSDSVLRPSSDRTDRHVSPYSPSKLLMNVIDAGWGNHGQWLEWDVEVEVSGFYQLSFRYQQEALKGLSSARRLSVDGAVPFAEAACLLFPYANGWRMYTAADASDQPYQIYLSKGIHTIRLEAVLGELAPIIRELDDVVFDLNTVYRKIIMVTSATPDKYRDYNLDQEIPGLKDNLEECANKLQKNFDLVYKMAGGNAADCAILMTTVRQLRSFIEKPQTIPFRLASLQTNIGSISAWTLDIRRQPLAMDYFVFAQKNAKLPKTLSNFWDKIVHSVSMFACSFLEDYSGFGTARADKTISLWLGTGRDQSEILWKMTNDLFTPQTGIAVNIKLVSATMVEAFLSGNAPDVAINVTRDTPVNLAVRGALLDLSSFEDYRDVENWFPETAISPYQFQNGVYGLPDTQTFNMLFYRRDILEELQLPIPKTWDEFENVAHQLHLYRLEAGVPGELDAASMYYTLLMQNGGKVFSEDLSQTLLDTPSSLRAFDRWTGFFTKVGLPVTYNFFNRFRSGEMPLAIAPYTAYNQLKSAAPEIRNLWDMTVIPGIRQEDGSINRTQSATGTAAVILSATEKPEEAWKFIKWWVSGTAQKRYIRDVESRMGVIARVAAANNDAFSSMDWSKKEFSLLNEQRQQISEVPQVPGNYYLDRDIINAFRDVVYNKRNSLEAIQEYGKRINGEISRKREEFGLE